VGKGTCAVGMRKEKKRFCPLSQKRNDHFTEKLQTGEASGAKDRGDKMFEYRFQKPTKNSKTSIFEEKETVVKKEKGQAFVGLRKGIQGYSPHFHPRRGRKPVQT